MANVEITDIEFAQEIEERLSILREFGYSSWLVSHHADKEDYPAVNEELCIGGNPIGVLFGLDECKSDEGLNDIADEINDVEERYGCKVFAAIVTRLSETFGGGLMHSMLVVSKYRDEWDAERERLAAKAPLAACISPLSWGWEFGEIGIDICGGGLVRTF